MCLVKPLKIISLSSDKAVLENGIEALYDKSSGPLAVGDLVIVYGNYIISSVKAYEQSEA